MNARDGKPTEGSVPNRAAAAPAAAARRACRRVARGVDGSANGSTTCACARSIDSEWIPASPAISALNTSAAER